MGNIISLSPFRQKRKPKVLFLTTVPPSEIKAEWPFYQNWFLPQLIRDRGATVDLLCWRSAELNAAMVSAYDIVTFLWCNEYHEHPKEFPDAVRNILFPAQSLNRGLHVFNDPVVVLWNTDKHYLLELVEAGFRVPRSNFLDVSALSRTSLTSSISEFSDSRSIVLKPAISGSAHVTHLIKNAQALTADDEAFLDKILVEGTHGDLILQEYEEAISAGEYSLIFINGAHTHTILKMPQAGEYRCQGEYGGSTKEILAEDVPQDARDTAKHIFAYLDAKFNSRQNEASHPTRKALVYARIDGVMKDDVFVLMEVEAIEPHLWLEAETGSLALEELCKIFIPNEI